MSPSHSDPIFKPTVIRSAMEDVYLQLRQAILDGDISPGYRLIEQALADSCQVSRTPVREALKRLTMEGLVSSDGQRGLIVSRISLESIIGAYEAREVLEGLAARLAAQAQDKFLGLQALERSLTVIESLAIEPAQLNAAHDDFHNRIADLSGNSYVIQWLKELSLFRTRMVTLRWIPKTRVEQSLPDHRAIYNAIKNQEPERAEYAARAHVKRTRDTLIKRLTSEKE